MKLGMRASVTLARPLPTERSEFRNTLRRCQKSFSPARPLTATSPSGSKPHTMAPRRSRPQDPFADRNLPMELQVKICSCIVQSELPVIATTSFRKPKLKTKRAMAGSATARDPYYQAMNDYMMKSALRIDVVVKDLNFSNLRAYLTALSKANHLEDFVLRPNFDHRGSSGAPRQLRIFYHTTKALPDGFGKVLSFVNFVNGLIKRVPGAPGRELHMRHEVRSCGDVGALNLLLQSMYMVEISDMSTTLHTIFTAFCRKLENVRAQQERDRQARMQECEAMERRKYEIAWEVKRKAELEYKSSDEEEEEV